MTGESSQIELSGVLIRGAEGNLYFIPSEDLAAFQVPEETAAPAREALDQRDDVAGFAQLSPQVTLVPALYGPLGRRDAVSGPTDPTVAVVTPIRGYRT